MKSVLLKMEDGEPRDIVFLSKWPPGRCSAGLEPTDRIFQIVLQHQIVRDAQYLNPVASGPS